MVGHSQVGQELAIFEPIWLGDACPKASILRHAGCERATPFTSKTHERANAVAESDQRRHIPRSFRGRLASPVRRLIQAVTQNQAYFEGRAFLCRHCFRGQALGLVI